MKSSSNAQASIPDDQRQADLGDGDGPSEGSDNWVLFKRVPNAVEASLVEGLLGEHDILSVVENVFFSQEPTSFGALGEFKIHVLERDLEAAQSVLDEVASKQRPPIELV